MGDMSEQQPRLDADQASALARPESTVVVLGGPGTGRTTVCVERVSAHLEAGGRLDEVLVLAASRASAQDLRTRLVSRVGGSHLGVQVMTVHALARNLVSEEDPRVRLLTAPEQEFRIRELLDATDLSRWPPSLRAAARTGVLPAEIRVLAATVLQGDQDPRDLTLAGQRHGVEAWQVLGPFLETYLDVLALEGSLDYAEAVRRARHRLDDPDVLASLVASTRLLVCDDAQECDPSQLDLVTRIAAAGVPTLIAADPDQTVYAFRGADPSRLDEAVSGLSSVGVAHLRSSHRCSGEVLDAVEEMRGRLPQVPTSPSWRRAPMCPVTGGGRVLSLTAPTSTRLVRDIASLLRGVHRREGVAWHEMAVVARRGADLPLISAVLGSEGIAVHRSRDETALAGIHAVSHLSVALDVAATLAEGRAPTRHEVDLLVGGPMCDLPPAVSDRWHDWAGAHGVELDWNGVLACLGRGGCAEQGRSDGTGEHGGGAPGGEEPARTGDDAAGGPEEPAESTPSPPPGLVQQLAPVAAMVDRVVAAAAALASGAAVGEALWRLWGGSAWESRLRQRALAGEASADRDLDGLCSLFDLAQRGTVLSGPGGARRLARVVAEEQIPADRARESDADRQGVAVLTAHRTRGRQFRVVAVTGLEEGSWPSPDHTGSLVSADRWSARGAIAPAGWRDWKRTVAAERRLLLVACSRATDLVLAGAVVNDESRASSFHTALARSGRAFGEPGVAGREQDTAVQEDAAGRDGRDGRTDDGRTDDGCADLPDPDTLDDLVGQLRRCLVDLSRSPALRREAARCLAGLASARDEGAPLVPGAHPRSWWRDGTDSSAPTRPELVELSPSHVAELLTCSRRWFLTRRVGASGADTTRSGAGSLVHAVAADHMADWSLPRAVADLDERWSQVEVAVPWYGQVEHEGAHQALERLDRWLAGRNRELVGTEVAVDCVVDLPAALVRLRGAIDRLERDETGRFLVVDLKAGTSASPHVLDAHRLQVGVYQAAVAAGGLDGSVTGDLADPGAARPAGAELVYLRQGAGRGHLQPRVVRQPSLEDVPWPADGDDAASGPPDHAGAANWVLASLAEAARIVAEDDHRAVPNPGCGHCPVRSGCPALVPPDPAYDRHEVAAGSTQPTPRVADPAAVTPAPTGPGPDRDHPSDESGRRSRR